MAKEQNLPLNPVKISGVCGRLLCCLGHEYETYKEMNEERAHCAAAEAAVLAAESSVAVASNRPVTPEPEDKITVPPITESDDQLAPAAEGTAVDAGTIHKRRRRRRR
jgi:hypothetical protein